MSRIIKITLSSYMVLKKDTFEFKGTWVESKRMEMTYLWAVTIRELE